MLLKHNEHRTVDSAKVVEVGTDYADVMVDNADIVALLWALSDTSSQNYLVSHKLCRSRLWLGMGLSCGVIILLIHTDGMYLDAGVGVWLPVVWCMCCFC